MKWFDDIFAFYNVVGELADKFCYKTLPRLDNNCDHALQDCEQEFAQRFGKDSQPYGCKCRTDRTNLYHKCSCNVMCWPKWQGVFSLKGKMTIELIIKELNTYLPHIVLYEVLYFGFGSSPAFLIRPLLFFYSNGWFI